MYSTRLLGGRNEGGGCGVSGAAKGVGKSEAWVHELVYKGHYLIDGGQQNMIVLVGREA